MGEVVRIGQNMEAAPETGADSRMKDESSSRVIVKWERFLQRMMLRVLLVEADDSTRQIIAALLRKCGYRVAAVPDGLKAWELLKGGPDNIDLILTEVDLPSISGFPLLTLIMDHEICKNIPVIMMSSLDAVSTVYKCMMRGAADYLVKPIRRNELRNLWQHVWRRQSSTARINGLHEGVGQEIVEVTSENEAASNHSNGCVDDVHTHKAYNGKGSDSQSSCTKPEVEAESPLVENMQESSQENTGRSFLGHLKLRRDAININLYQKPIVLGNKTGGTILGTNGNINEEITSADTTDLIGAFADYPECNHRNSFSSNGTSHFDHAWKLDLSLRRCHPSDLEDNLITERHTLTQSTASAFSRYKNRPIQHLQHKFLNVFYEQKQNGTNPEKPLSDMPAGYASHNPDPRLSMQPSSVSPTSDRSNQMKIASATPVRVEGLSLGNCSIFCAQSEKLFDPLHRNPSNAANQPREKPGQKLNSFEDHGRISPATDLSPSSSFCHSGSGYGNTSGRDFNNVNQVPIAMNIAETTNEEVELHSSKDLHRWTQREAALTKFRLKRKDRCYEKKVRYESRKKLAEQRPRVKGQFVRR